MRGKRGHGVRIHVRDELILDQGSKHNARNLQFRIRILGKEAIFIKKVANHALEDLLLSRNSTRFVPTKNVDCILRKLGNEEKNKKHSSMLNLFE